MKYNYNLDLDKVHPTIKEKITSPQFHFSEKILDKRIELGYDYEKMAEISNTTIDTFVKMENSDINIKLDDYVDALFNIEIFETQLIKPDENKHFKDDNVEIKFNNDNKKMNLSGGVKWQLLAT